MHLGAHNWIHVEPFEDTVRRLAHHGYRSVEVVNLPSYPGEREARRALAENGVRARGTVTAMREPWSMISPEEKFRAAAISHVEECIEMARQLEAEVVTLVPTADGPVAPDVDPAEQWKWAVECLRYLEGRATSAGSKLAIEPLNRYETYFIYRADQALALAEAVGPRCGVCLDVFHMNIEEADPLSSIRGVGARLADFHISDTNRLASGMGHWDWPATIDVLREVGYQGGLMLELIAAISRVPMAELTVPTESSLLGRLEPALSDEDYELLVAATAATILPLLATDGR